jgi:hypothetical protein
MSAPRQGMNKSESSTEDSFDYHRYMASREWALKRKEVRKRSGGMCERCHRAKMQQVHHLTYERTGRELLTDLLGVCRPCHAFLSAKSDIDPCLSHTPYPLPKVPLQPIAVSGKRMAGSHVEGNEGGTGLVAVIRRFIKRLRK